MTRLIRIIAQQLEDKIHLDVMTAGEEKPMQIIVDLRFPETASIAIREAAEAFFHYGSGAPGIAAIPQRINTVRDLELQALELEALARGQKGNA